MFRGLVVTGAMWWGALAWSQETPTVATDANVMPAGSAWTLRPVVELAWNFDSNVYLDRDPTLEFDDHFFDTVLAAFFSRQVVYNGISGYVWGRWRRYGEAVNMNSDDVGERVTLRLGDHEQWHLIVAQSYVSLSDYEYVSEVFTPEPVSATLYDNVRNRSERTQRTLLGLNGALHGPIGERSGLVVRYGYSDTSYEDGVERNVDGLDTEAGADVTTVDYFDTQSSVLTAAFATRLTDKTAGQLGVDYVRYEGEGLTEAGHNLAIRLGLHSRVTAKSEVGLDLGYQWYTQGDDKEQAGAEEVPRELSIVAYGDWQMTHKSRLRLQVWNTIDPTPDQVDNARQVYVGTANLAYAMTRRLHWDLAAIYRLEDYFESLAGEDLGEGDNREIEQLSVRGRLSFIPKVRWARLFGEISYEDTTDTFYGEYDQLRLTLAANLRY